MSKPVYLYVTPFFPSPVSWRGSYCYDFVRSLMKSAEYDVMVFKPGHGADYEIGGVKVYRFPTKHLPSNVFPFLFTKWNQQSFVKKLTEVLIANNEQQTAIAVCHAHTANCVIYPCAIKRNNPKCLTLLHHHDPESFGLNLGLLKHCWLYNMVMFPILRKWHERIDCHVFVSEMVKRSFLSAPNASWSVYDGYHKQMRGLPYRSVRIKNVLVAHNGVDTSIFNPSLRPSTTPHKFTIGCIGNFIDWKDQETLIRAVALLKDAKVVFIGTGERLGRCKHVASKLNVNAEFHTEVPHEQLVDFYNSIDLFVLPSHFEGFGCVFTEAWASGVPFITCEGQGMSDLIPEEDCGKWLCHPKDPMDLAKKITVFMANRWEQRLSGPVDFDTLVPQFLSQLKQFL